MQTELTPLLIPGKQQSFNTFSLKNSTLSHRASQKRSRKLLFKQKHKRHMSWSDKDSKDDIPNKTSNDVPLPAIQSVAIPIKRQVLQQHIGLRLLRTPKIQRKRISLDSQRLKPWEDQVNEYVKNKTAKSRKQKQEFPFLQLSKKFLKLEQRLMGVRKTTSHLPQRSSEQRIVSFMSRYFKDKYENSQGRLRNDLIKQKLKTDVVPMKNCDSLRS